MNNVSVILLLMCTLFALQTVVLAYELRSPRVNEWGNWGNWEYCPGDGIVTAVMCKVEVHQGSGVSSGDDTALNGIGLRCNHPEDSFRLTSWITSSVGIWGNWVKMESCPYGSYAYGFQLRSEKPLGGGENDDTAANDIYIYCRSAATGNQVDSLSGHGHSWGDWTEPQYCPSGYGICGIQTQVEPSIGQGQNDDTALNNVDMKCCRYSHEMLYDNK